MVGEKLEGTFAIFNDCAVVTYPVDFNKNKMRIEYVFLDWFVGVGFDVTEEDYAIWLFDFFHDTQTDMVKYEEAINN